MQLLRSTSTASVAFLLLTLLSTSYSQVTTSCNPTKVTCPNDIGLNNPSYFVDFTKAKFLSPDWTIASGAKIPFTQKGAELTFAKRHDAPTMWTNFKIFFGRVEFVVQAAPGTGIVSSMVLLSDDLDEIDWEFLGGKKGEVQTNYFGKGFTGTYNRSTTVPVADTQGTSHKYALDWSTEALVWSIDGKVVRTLRAADADGNGSQYPQSPMKVSLSLWDAGDPDAPGTQEWAGGVTPIPPPEPYTMYIKSVKIENRNPGKGYQYTDRSGSWKSIKVLKEEGQIKSSVSSEKQSTETLGMFSSNGAASKPSTSSKLSSSVSSTSESTSMGPTFSAPRGSSSVLSTISASAHIPSTPTTSGSNSATYSAVVSGSRTSNIPSSAGSGHSTSLLSTLSTISISTMVCNSTTLTTKSSSHIDASVANTPHESSSSTPQKHSSETAISSNSLSSTSGTFSSAQDTPTAVSPSISAPATGKSGSTAQPYSNVSSAISATTSIASTSPILGPFTSSSLIPAAPSTSSLSTSSDIKSTLSSSPLLPSSPTSPSVASLPSDSFRSSSPSQTATTSQTTADVIYPVSSSVTSSSSSGDANNIGNNPTSASVASASPEPNAITGGSASSSNPDTPLAEKEPTSISSSTLSLTLTSSRTSVVLITTGFLATSTAAAIQPTSYAKATESAMASPSITPFTGAAARSIRSQSGARTLALGMILGLMMFI